MDRVCAVCGKLMVKTSGGFSCSCGYGEWSGPHYLNHGHGVSRNPKTIKELIEDEAKGYAEDSCGGLASTEDIADSKQDFQAGALWAMRWWSERWFRFRQPWSDDERLKMIEEMNVATKGILEGKV